MQVRRKKPTRQLTLAEQDQETPLWSTLPEESRREVVTLLARLLRNEAGTEEVGDE